MPRAIPLLVLLSCHAHLSFACAYPTIISTGNSCFDYCSTANLGSVQCPPLCDSNGNLILTCLCQNPVYQFNVEGCIEAHCPLLINQAEVVGQQLCSSVKFINGGQTATAAAASLTAASSAAAFTFMSAISVSAPQPATTPAGSYASLMPTISSMFTTTSALAASLAPVSSSMPLASSTYSNGSHKLGVGAIVGIAVGGVIGLIGLIIVILSLAHCISPDNVRINPARSLLVFVTCGTFGRQKFSSRPPVAQPQYSQDPEVYQTPQGFGADQPTMTTQQGPGSAQRPYLYAEIDSNSVRRPMYAEMESNPAGTARRAAKNRIATGSSGRG